MNTTAYKNFLIRDAIRNQAKARSYAKAARKARETNNDALFTIYSWQAKGYAQIARESLFKLVELR